VGQGGEKEWRSLVEEKDEEPRKPMGGGGGGGGGCGGGEVKTVRTIEGYIISGRREAMSGTRASTGLKKTLSTRGHRPTLHFLAS